MLKSAKRSFDDITAKSPPPCSPHRIHFLNSPPLSPFSFTPSSSSSSSSPFVSPFNKRPRTFMEEENDNNTDKFMTPRKLRRRNINEEQEEEEGEEEECPFQPSTPFSTDTVDRFEPRKRHKPNNSMETSNTHSTSNTSSQPCTDGAGGKLFTLDEVKSIVAQVVAERENQLRQEYNNVLQNQLLEQFKTFSKFNEDYISRQLQQSEYTYMS